MPTTSGYTCRTFTPAVPSALELLRGVTQPPPAPPAPQQAAAPPSPFTYDDWQPNPTPSHPREAVRLVRRNGQPFAWWRQEWVPPMPLPTYSPPITLEGFAQDALYTVSGELIAVSVDPQSLMNHLAASC
jgi:hypothetical protein